MTNKDYIKAGLKVGDKVKIKSNVNYPHSERSINDDIFIVKDIRNNTVFINTNKDYSWELLSNQIIEVITEFKIEDIYK